MDENTMYDRIASILRGLHLVGRDASEEDEQAAKEYLNKSYNRDIEMDKK